MAVLALLAQGGPNATDSADLPPEALTPPAQKYPSAVYLTALPRTAIPPPSAVLNLW